MQIRFKVERYNFNILFEHKTVLFRKGQLFYYAHIIFSFIPIKIAFQCNFFLFFFYPALQCFLSSYPKNCDMYVQLTGADLFAFTSVHFYFKDVRKSQTGLKMINEGIRQLTGLPDLY